MTTQLKLDIENILVNEIIANKCNVFDSHSVIAFLIQEYSDHYLQACTKTNTVTTANYHSFISKEIKTIAEKYGYKEIGKAWSKNIRDRFTENTKNKIVLNNYSNEEHFALRFCV